MKFMTTWALKDGVHQEAVDMFLAGHAAPHPGVTLLGRWHAVDLSHGFSLYATDNAAALYEGASRWAPLMDLETVPVIEDDEAGPALARTFAK